MDDLGRQITLARPAQRIVALSPHATGLLIAAGVIGSPGRHHGSDFRHAEERHCTRISGPGALDRARARVAVKAGPRRGLEFRNRAQDLDWLDRTGIALFAASRRTWRISPRQSGRSVDLPALRRSPTRLLMHLILGLRALRPAPTTTRLCRGVGTPPMVIGGRHWINDALRGRLQNQFAAHDAGAFAIAPEAMLAAAGGAQRISLMPGLHQPCRRDRRPAVDQDHSCHARCSCCANCARYRGAGADWQPAPQLSASRCLVKYQ